MPYLNGGLFENILNYDWKNSFLNIPNDIFSNNKVSFFDSKKGIIDCNSGIKLKDLNSLIVPIEMPDNLNLNELELSLFKNNNKISFDNNKFIIINFFDNKK